MGVDVISILVFLKFIFDILIKIVFFLFWKINELSVDLTDDFSSKSNLGISFTKKVKSLVALFWFLYTPILVEMKSLA